MYACMGMADWNRIIYRGSPHSGIPCTYSQPLDPVRRLNHAPFSRRRRSGSRAVETCAPPAQAHGRGGRTHARRRSAHVVSMRIIQCMSSAAHEPLRALIKLQLQLYLSSRTYARGRIAFLCISLRRDAGVVEVERDGLPPT